MCAMAIYQPYTSGQHGVLWQPAALLLLPRYFLTRVMNPSVVTYYNA
jgi:hypothetical protein